jgi:hypothetical protein
MSLKFGNLKSYAFALLLMSLTVPVTAAKLIPSSIYDQFAFSISTPASQSASQGASAIFMFTVTTTMGTPEPVLFGLLNPSGTTISWIENPVAPSKSGTIVQLTIQTSCNTPAQSYDSLQITGSAGGIEVSSGSFALTVSASESCQNVHEASITSVVAVPDPVGRGSKMIFTVIVQNIGDVDIGSIKVQLKIHKPDGKLAASPSKTANNFKAGSQITAQLTFSLPRSAPLGVWMFDVFAAHDSTPLDQKLGQSFTVQPPIVSGVILSIRDNGPVARGATAAFTVTIKNTGNTIWPSAKITIKVNRPDGKLFATLTLSVKKVVPGVEYQNTKNLMVPSNAHTGTYAYIVTLNQNMQLDSQTLAIQVT